MDGLLGLPLQFRHLLLQFSFKIPIWPFWCDVQEILHVYVEGGRDLSKNDCYQILGPFCLVFSDDLFRQALDVFLERIFYLLVGLTLAQRSSFGVKVPISQDRLFGITT